MDYSDNKDYRTRLNQFEENEEIRKTLIVLLKITFVMFFASIVALMTFVYLNKEDSGPQQIGYESGTYKVEDGKIVKRNQDEQ